MPRVATAQNIGPLETIRKARKRTKCLVNACFCISHRESHVLPCLKGKHGRAPSEEGRTNGKFQPLHTCRFSVNLEKFENVQRCLQIHTIFINFAKLNDVWITRRVPRPHLESHARGRLMLAHKDLSSKSRCEHAVPKCLIFKFTGLVRLNTVAVHQTFAEWADPSTMEDLDKLPLAMDHVSTSFWCLRPASLLEGSSPI